MKIKTPEVVRAVALALVLGAWAGTSACRTVTETDTSHPVLFKPSMPERPSPPNRPSMPERPSLPEKPPPPTTRKP